MKTIYIFEGKENNNIIKDELNLYLDEDTTISLYNTNLNFLTITIKDDIEVNINDFNKLSNNSLKIIFNIHSNSILNYNLSNIVENNYSLNIWINYLGDNSKVDTNIHSLVKGNEKIRIEGIVKRHCKNNELLEQVKVMLIDNGKCEVIPEMMIDTNKVIANHKVAISNIRNNELFYLTSKGLSQESSINLIKKSFLLSNLKDNKLIQIIKDN